MKPKTTIWDQKWFLIKNKSLFVAPCSLFHQGQVFVPDPELVEGGSLLPEACGELTIDIYPIDN